MFGKKILAGSMIGMVALMMTTQTEAGTVGLWFMDDLYDATPSPNPGVDPNPPGGLTTSDSSGNALDLVTQSDAGTLSQSGDVAGVMPGGTTSLESLVGGASNMITPSSSLLHRGNTGEMTVEFWFKSLRITPSVAYVMSFDGGNGGAFAGDWGIYSTSAGDLKFFEYSNGFPEVGSTAVASNGSWHHVAYTVNAAGVMTSYLDGVLQGQSAATGPAAAALADVLRLGANPNVSFADHDFLIDELRISDVALLPGNGSGVDELAWNASLVPEPATLTLLALGGFSLAQRRRS